MTKRNEQLDEAQEKNSPNQSRRNFLTLGLAFAAAGGCERTKKTSISTVHWATRSSNESRCGIGNKLQPSLWAVLNT